MELIELEISKYKRFYVPGIKHIIYRPQRNIQTILASNGSGKSSLLKEIIPNVEELNTEYDTNGYRKATYLHNNKTYILSYTRNGNKHSFMVDGVELNQGGLKKIQKMLIEEHFRITKPIHEMLLSITTFTNMSVSERKRWFTNIITNVDYAYAMELFNKTKTRVRDLTSFIKLTQSKILQDENSFKLYSDSRLKQLHSDKDMFEEILKDLLDTKLTISNVEKPNNGYIKTVMNKLVSLTSKINNDTTKAEVLKKIITTETMLQNCKDNLVNISKELDEADDMGVDTGIDIGLLKKNSKSINNKINDIKPIFDISLVDYIVLLRELEYKYSDIIQALSNIYEYKDYHTDKDGYNKLINDIKITTSNINNVDQNISTIDKQITIQQDHATHDDATCPKCSFQFKPYLDKDLLASSKKELSKLLDVKQQLETTLDTYKTLLNKLDSKFRYIRELKLILSTDKLSLLYTYILDKTDKFTNLDNIISDISNLRITLPEAGYIEDLLEQQSDVNGKLELYTKLSSDKLDYILKRKKELLDKRVTEVVKINELTTMLSKHKSSLSVYKQITELTTELHKLNTEVKYYKHNLYNIEYNKHLGDAVRLVKYEITNIEDDLNNHKQLQQHYNNLKSELKQYETELAATKHLEEYLSPSKGIIGESIINTINVVLEKMNFIINKIWSYDITILPCNIGEVDLTFRFPVMINNVKGIPDISKGSSSIKEVIDFAFKIVAMELLDMLNYPLILDEFGKTMDEKHRIQSYKHIEELGKQYFNQIYLVSHFESMYGRFNNVDVVVLNNDNLNYTGTHNEVIKIT